jgi:zinc protease
VIDRTEVDGVPTLVARRPGPVRAGLAFRVGRADETLARGGISHLTEHLALHQAGLTDYHINGSTGAVVTDFHVQGSTDEVAGFLTGVCRALHDPPAARLETEKSIVRTEWSNRTPSALDDMPLWRYGARDYGLVSYPELGLPMLRLDDLRQWAAQFFTRENAVLWIAGDGLPGQLRLPLPAGERRPVPAPSSALPTTPAYFPGPPRVVGLSGVVHRNPAALVFAVLLKRELFRSLRQQSGLSYSVDSAIDPRGDGFATILALVDALPEKQDAALGGFVDVLAGLRVGRIAEADVAALVGQGEEELSHPDAAAKLLPSYAFDLLTGRPFRSPEEVRADLREVTAGSLHEVAQEMMSSALLMVPGGHRADWAGFAPAPTASATIVTGSRYRSRVDGGADLVIGAEGVSVAHPEAAATVRFDECAALLVWPDGGRQLFGGDGIVVRVEPTLYSVDPTALKTIDTAVPVGQQVLMPARSADEIPRPERVSADRPGRPGMFETVATVVVSVAAVVLICFGGLATVAVGSDDETSSDGGVWVVVAATWCLAVATALPAVLLIRRRLRSRRR